MVYTKPVFWCKWWQNLICTAHHWSLFYWSLYFDCFIFLFICLFIYYLCTTSTFKKPKFMLHSLCLWGGCCDAVKRFKFLIIGWCTIFCKQGGDKFHILLKEIASCEIDYAACFQNCGTVDLEQTVNPFTLTGFTPSKFSLNSYVYSSINVCFCSHVELLCTECLP